MFLQRIYYGIIALKKQITPNLFHVSHVVEKPAQKDAPSNLAVPAFWMDDVKLVKNPVSRTSVVVDAQNSIRSLDKKMFGAGTFTWDWSLGMPATKAKMIEAGITFLNFPGGNTADDYDWLNNRAVSTGVHGYVSTDQYLQIASDINADKMLTANYGSGTPQMAADWLTYCNVARGANVIYWSIGNECMQEREPDTRTPPYAHDAWTYAQFVHDCIVLMRAIDPRVKIGVCGTIGPWDFPQRVSVINPRTGQSENGWGPVMLSRLRDLGTLPDYYDFHQYPASPGRETDNTTLQAGGSIQFLLGIVRPMLQDYLGPAGTSLPVNLTETNSTFIPVGKQTTSLTNALFLADYWGNNCKAGMGAFVWWNLHNAATVVDGNFHESLYGWRTYATLGMLSEGLPEGLSEPLNTPYPTFYAYKLLKQFANAGDTLVQASSNNELLSVYASRSAVNGRLRLLVINKAKNADISAEFWISHYTVPLLGTKYKYGMSEDLSMSDLTLGAVTLTRPVVGSGQSRTAITFERYSITVIEM